MLSEEQAVARAKEVAAEEGWAWADPAQATLRRAWLGKGGKWEILSNAQGMGAKVRMVIDAETGEVLSKGHVPR